MTNTGQVIGFIETLSADEISGWAYRPGDASPLRLTPAINGEPRAAVICNEPCTANTAGTTALLQAQGRSLHGPNLGFSVRLDGDEQMHRLQLLTEDGAAVALATEGAAPRDEWNFYPQGSTVLGWIEPGAPGEMIRGWAAVQQLPSGQLHTGVEVMIHTDSEVLARLEANEPRFDVAEVIGCDPHCGFTYWLADDLLTAPRQPLHFTVVAEQTDLPNSPISIGTAPADTAALPAAAADADADAAAAAAAAAEAESLSVGNHWPSLLALFSERHYRAALGLADLGLIETLRHYATIGLPRGVSPTPLFDPAVYISRAREAGLPPLQSPANAVLHFLRHGLPARIVPTRLFDESFYQATYPELAASGRFGFDHFIAAGLAEGRRPNAWFDPQWYAAGRTDLAMPPYLHFLLQGNAAGLAPNRFLANARLPGISLDDWALRGSAMMNSFNWLLQFLTEADIILLLSLYVPNYYRMAAGLPHPTTVMEGLCHFLSVGINKDLSPSPLFDSRYYASMSQLATNEPVAENTSRILHWLRHGRNIVTVPTQLFSEAYYRHFYIDMREPDIDVFDHFIRYGIQENRVPNFWFDPQWYAAHAPARTAQPHYLEFLVRGAPARLANRVLWLLSGGGPYVETNPTDADCLQAIDSFAALAAATAPWLDSLTIEQVKLAALLFAPETYTGDGALPPDTTLIGRLAHFLGPGLAHGELEAPLFSAAFYRAQLAARGLPLAAGASPLLHFLQHGSEQEILPMRNFDEKNYRRANADLLNLRSWLFLHFVRDGLHEGRPFSTRPMITLAPAFDESVIARARKRLFLGSGGMAAPGDMPPALRHIAAAQADVTCLLGSQTFAEIMARAQAIDPLVGEVMQPRDLLVPPLHDEIWPALRALRARLRRDHYDHIICAPWLRSGGADLVSGFLSHALREMFPSESILFLQTDQPNFDRGDWLAPEIDTLDMSDITKGVTAADAERLVFTIIRGLAPRGIYNVNSRLCWQVLRRYGRRLGADVQLFAYMFCWDQTASGVRVGYPSEFFSDTHGCLTALLTDTAYLKNELIRTYALPPQVSDRIIPLASPSRAVPPAVTMAEQGAASAATRLRPLFLWGGRIDRQKRFDLVIAIAAAMPDCDFRCWGSAMLDQPPDLAGLPGNIAMMGDFKQLTELPLGQCEGWLFTSAWEGMPTTIIELGVRGMPIVASNVGGISELIDEHTGWLVDPFDDVAAFVICLRQMIASPAARIARGRNLQEKTVKLYNMQAYKDNLAQIFARRHDDEGR